MQTPFSITLFSTTGDPQGIRHVEKSNWSGFGVVFSKGQFGQLKQERGYDQAGVYILVGNAAEETIYIGEADPVGTRLKNHVANKEGWSWGVYFVDGNRKLGKTEVQFLESELYALARKHGRAIITNKNKPQPPSMSPPAKAGAQAFLDDMLLILPMLGINAFTPLVYGEISDVPQPANGVNAEFDTVVVPAQEEGFQAEFINRNCWYAIRINAKHIDKLQYIVAYRVAPTKAITHIAEIDSIEPYQDTGKYMVKFKEAAQTIGPIPRLENDVANMQSPRYALKSKLLAAKHLDAVWSE